MERLINHCKFRTMKYIIRSIKYFFYFAFLTTAIIVVLVLTGMSDGNVETMFRGGYDAIWKIALFFAAVAAVYPKVGFIRRHVAVQRPWNEIREEVTGYMRERQFELETESADTVTFRHKGMLNRLTRMFEDRVTLELTSEGFELEGLRKDVFRLATGLEYRLNPQQNQS